MPDENEEVDESEDEYPFNVGFDASELYTMQVLMSHAQVSLMETSPRHALMAESLFHRVSQKVNSEEFQEHLEEESLEAEQNYNDIVGNGPTGSVPDDGRII